MQNRIIKFRAWENNRMYTDLAYISMSGKAMSKVPDTPLVKPILMQYTGLKDKNGKEIYEFDIVKAWIDFGPGGEHLVTFPVTSSPFGVNIQEWNYKENRLPEVIGNIYEHSHLLK